MAITLKAARALHLEDVVLRVFDSRPLLAVRGCEGRSHTLQECNETRIRGLLRRPAGPGPKPTIF